MPTPSLAMRMKFAKSEADVKNYFENHFELPDAHISWVDLSAPHIFFEAKQRCADIYQMLAQLILTIHRHQSEFEYLPDYIGGFDGCKCGIVEFDELYQKLETYSDINWNQTPSMVDAKTIALVKKFTDEIGTLKIYDFARDAKELGTALRKITSGRAPDGRALQRQINFGNYVSVFMKFAAELSDNIEIPPESSRDDGIELLDFYLADLMSQGNQSIDDLNKLKVLRDGPIYRSNKQIAQRFFIEPFKIKDPALHEQFWSRYKRPPKREYWDKIIERRDLLVPRAVRERKGAFFTPSQWVARATEYMADLYGPEFVNMYVWDCAAGTGNLLQYLPQDRRNVFASTLDDPDVQIMKQTQITHENNIFQFDFLNDPFGSDKMPRRLYDILSNPDERKKLIIFINPPYSETDNRKDDRSGVSDTWVKSNYKNIISKATNEIFAQFLIRIYFELRNCRLAEFSKLKTLQAGNFADFRNAFRARLEKCFLIPADTFDNVRGQFPIGFKIWDTAGDEKFQSITADVYDKNNEFAGTKTLYSYNGLKMINDWIKEFKSDEKSIGSLNYTANDIQQRNYTCILAPGQVMGHNTKFAITDENLIDAAIYFAARLAPAATWLNDRDQFLYPSAKTEYKYLPVMGVPEKYAGNIVGSPTLMDTVSKFEYESDFEFKYDCLIYVLFHSQNRISSRDGTNHWIPFTEMQSGSRNAFDSNFMANFLASRGIPDILSPVARAVFDAGLNLWRYYFSKNPENHNASFYDIKEFFKGRKPDGKMNTKSNDAEFSRLGYELAASMSRLAAAIEPRIYEYGFLR